MTKTKIAICTTTFYKSDEEGSVRKTLARQFVEDAARKGYRTFVVDGGTDGGKFIDELRDLGADAFPETQHGLGDSRREALNHAYAWAVSEDVPFLVWSEPEKVSFVSSLDMLAEKMNETGAHLVVPSRRSFEGYPPAQIYSESFANQLHTDFGYVDKNGNPLDTFFGPKMWNRRVTPFFQIFGEKEIIAKTLADMRIEQLQKKYGIAADESIRATENRRASLDLIRTDHISQMPVCLIIKKNGTKFGQSSDARNYDILSIPVDYLHPQEQTSLERSSQRVYNAKRLAQLTAIAEQFELVQRIHEKGILDEKLDEMLRTAQ